MINCEHLSKRIKDLEDALLLMTVVFVPRRGEPCAGMHIETQAHDKAVDVLLRALDEPTDMNKRIEVLEGMCRAYEDRFQQKCNVTEAVEADTVKDKARIVVLENALRAFNTNDNTWARSMITEDGSVMWYCAHCTYSSAVTRDLIEHAPTCPVAIAEGLK